jgi:tryptophan 2-monooxygenase
MRGIGRHALRISTAFYHWLTCWGLVSRSKSAVAGHAVSVIDLEGKTLYVEKIADLPPMFKEIGTAWAKALEEGAGLSGLRQAIRERDVQALKEIWDRLIPIWDDRSFYDFVATSYAFVDRPFQHREVFGQVGFGTGGGFDYQIYAGNPACGGNGLRQNQNLLWAGFSRPRGCGNCHLPTWRIGPRVRRDPASRCAARARIDRAYGDKIAVTDRWGDTGLMTRCWWHCKAGCRPLT